MAKIGYMRVSTAEQNTDLQRDALEAVGCDEIYCDHGVSGTRRSRPEWDKALATVGEGDTLVIWKFDRAFRSLAHSLEVLGLLEERGAEFHAITEQIDTNTATGKLMYHIRNAFAEFEHTTISERTKAGQEAAWKRGAQKGRPKKLTDMKLQYAVDRIEAGEAVAQVAKDLGVARSTLYTAMGQIVTFRDRAKL